MALEQTPGVGFPTAEDGTRSTTLAGAQILAVALAELDAADAQSALQEPRWRRAYPRHFRKLVEGGLASPDAALASARAGLASAWETLRWDTGRGQTSLHEALAHPGAPLRTLSLRGQGDAAVVPWTVPLRGEPLSGTRLQEKIADWQARGIIEPSAARAFERCIANPAWFDLSDRRLVLLGAGSEAGPLRWLTRWRANVIAVDIQRPAVWQRVAELALAGNGTLHVPVRGPGPIVAEGHWDEQAGANLLTEAPKIAAWLRGFEGPLDVAGLAYLDGERHVRVAMGMDMIVHAACQADARTSVAFLATPTDVFAVPLQTAQTAMAAYLARPVASRTFQGSLHLAMGDRFFHPNVEGLVHSGNGRAYGVVDSLVIEQGPNYALAKRLQQWRALCARADGQRVSLNIAPSTTTASVIKNPALAAGFAGASSFGIEVFEPETTNALMAALWVHDLRFDGSTAHPGTPLAHPFELFMDNACHGGLWTSAYLPRSALPFAAALGWVRKRIKG